MYSIIEISGGIGKNIMATAVISGIKKTHPDREIIVITAYPGVFLNNPEVHRVFPFGKCPYFYEDYVKDKDVLFFCDEPYRSNGYLNQNQHLIKAWGDMLGIECDITPKLYLNARELQATQSDININKPLLMFQPFGGAENQKHKYSWNRDIPPAQAQEIANILSEKYHVLQPLHGNQIPLDNCEHITADIRRIFCLLLMSTHLVGIDSCLQHAAKAVIKPATVCWVTNTPIVFGYDIHTNIIPPDDVYKKKQSNIDGYFTEYDFVGSREHDYPFKSSDVFNITEIVEPLMRNN